MREPHESRGLLFGQKNKRDDRGSAIVIVIIAMALIGILATTILWASYLNYRIKINDLKVKNSFYSAETVVEQIMAGVKKEIVSASVNEAYQQVLSNWDALGTDSNRESFFVMEYIKQVEEKLAVSGSAPNQTYDREILKNYVDSEFWNEDNANGYIVEAIWDDPTTPPRFKPFETSGTTVDTNPDNNSTMTIKNVCVEFYDSDGLLSIINTDIAIDVPKLRFTQAGTIDRLYPYVFVGEEGIEIAENFSSVNINGSIYGGVDEHNNGGIQIGRNSRVTVEDASYIISGGEIVVGNDPDPDSLNRGGQNAELIVRGASSGGLKPSVYAQGLAVNSSHLDITGKVFVANDLILSGMGSNVSLAGQYLGYGNENGRRLVGTETDEHGNPVYINPAAKSSAIVINGKNSTVDLTDLNTLLLAGRAYVSLSDNEDASAFPHVLMGESISVKSNQIAYLVPPECVGTLDGKTVIGQNPVAFSTWTEMLANLANYAAEGDFRIVDATRPVTKLGGDGHSLGNYGISDITAANLSGVDLNNAPMTITHLNNAGIASRVRFLLKDNQVYLYLVMDAGDAEEYFASYYNVNSNKASLDSYFNQYAPGGIKLKGDVQGYTVVGNSMVSLTDAAIGNNILTTPEGDNRVRLLSSVTLPADGDGGEGEGSDQPTDPDAYTEVSDNITDVANIRTEAELEEIIKSCSDIYGNLNRNLTEEDTGYISYDNVFDNLVFAEGTGGLKDYFDNYAPSTRRVEFSNGSDKAVLVDVGEGGTYTLNDSDIHLVVALGNVEVKCRFEGLIIANGKITVAENVECKKNGEKVYNVLQAVSEIPDDDNVPANFLENGSGMVQSGYEDAETDEVGNLRIDYSKIVRYENWIKK